MIGFDFKLRAVLESRRAEEERSERALARLLRERMILQSRLRALREDSRRDLLEGAGAMTGTLNMNRLNLVADRASRAAEIAGVIEDRLREVEPRVGEARRRMVRAMGRRRAIETLWQRGREIWRRAQRRREAGEMDELAMRLVSRGVV